MPNQSKVFNKKNPTQSERYYILKSLLEEAGRPEDYENIIELSKPPKDITEIANPGKFKNINVAVLGAGIAGLSCAFELRKLGFNITIFEANKNRIGGRIYTHYFSKDVYGEFGAMRIPTAHECVWHYIDLFKLNTRPFVQSHRNNLLYIKDIRMKNDPQGIEVMKKLYPKFKLTPYERKTPWQKLLGSATSEPLKKLTPEMRRDILETRPYYNPMYEKLSSYSFREIMKKVGLSEGAVNMLLNISPFSRYLQYNSFSEILHDEYPLNFKNLYEITGGFSTLPQKFYNSLTSKHPKEYSSLSPNNVGTVDFKMGSYVTKIHDLQNENKVKIVYGDVNSNKHKEKMFDYVVCTIPFCGLRFIDIHPQFSNKKTAAIMELNYTDSQKTIIFFNDRFWEKGGYDKEIFGGSSYTDMISSVVVYPSHSPEINKYNSSSLPGALISSYNLANDSTNIGSMKKSIRVNTLKSQLEKIHDLKPHSLDSIVNEAKTVHWSKEDFYSGDICFYYPGQKSLFSYAMTLPEFNNKVFFAGAHISNSHGWIQGAVKTAMTAANQLAETALKFQN